MSGVPSVQGSSQAWASVGSMWSTSFNGGWIADQRIGSTGGFTVNCSPSSSGYTFSSSGDGTTGASGNGYYALGRPVRIVQDSTTFYGWVASAAVAAGVTTVGISSGTATAALSTGPAFTSVAVATQSPVLAASTTPAATSRFHREDGSWAVPATATTTVITKAEVSAAFTTSSATYVNVTNAQIAVTVASTSNPVRVELINANLDAAASATNSYFAQIYNTTDTATIVELSQGGWANGFSLVWPMGRVITLAASAKTIDLQLKSASGNARFNQSSHVYTLMGTESR